MRIGVVCPYNIFKPGGVQSHVEKQIAILRSRGHIVWLITPRPRKYSEAPPPGVYFIGTSARVKAQATSVDISSLVDEADVREMYNQLKLDVIHFHEPFIPFVSRQLITQAPCPTVSSFHAALPETLVSRSISSLGPYLKPVLEATSVALAVSPAASELIQDLEDIMVRYVPNGIDLRSYKENKSSKRDPNTILFIGRLEKRKGAKALIEAFAILKRKKPAAKLKIAGDGQLRESLESYCRSNNIEDVEFLGYIDDQTKQKLLSTCSVYCSPALFGESFGIVLLEAMAMGAPTIAHANPGYEWVMKDTGRLSLVNAEDSVEFARRLQLMMEDEALRAAWLKWARQYVKQFDYRKIVDQYESIYRSVTRKK